ncbi:hypothetical protein PMAL9190_01339 [Photobacterium malacitanum]|uniref:Uncharacterized protein n=1 Tax=Photobacterium malacitanum TaxID=2204294 RepID=A0A1Y6MDR0_9GAMM|nr:hypothetical protein [Photobacterium malacitanum]SMY33880.1 hypothetical protein PMAL9190_01339 [Photobacterium malacitanum]
MREEVISKEELLSLNDELKFLVKEHFYNYEKISISKFICENLDKLQLSVHSLEDDIINNDIVSYMDKVFITLKNIEDIKCLLLENNNEIDRFTNEISIYDDKLNKLKLRYFHDFKVLSLLNKKIRNKIAIFLPSLCFSLLVLSLMISKFSWSLLLPSILFIFLAVLYSLYTKKKLLDNISKKRKIISDSIFLIMKLKAYSKGRQKDSLEKIVINRHLFENLEFISKEVNDLTQQFNHRLSEGKYNG